MEDAEIAAETDRFAITFVDGPRAKDVLAAAIAAGARGASLDRTGLGGAVIAAAADARARVDAAIATAIAEVRGAIGDDAGWEALRVLRGVPRFGVDFDGTTYPQEAGLEKTAVSFAKGCYLGQEVVCMLEMRGHVKRRLVPLAVDAEVALSRGAEVVDAGGQKVGEVTSAASIPSRGLVALAMVKRAHAAEGTELAVGGAKARVIAPEA
jgi:folate-binding protein YgfZ